MWAKGSSIKDSSQQRKIYLLRKGTWYLILDFFTFRVCQEFCPWKGRGQTGQTRQTPRTRWRHPSLLPPTWSRHPPDQRQTPPWQTSPKADGYCSGQYASYWNAFLFIQWTIAICWDSVISRQSQIMVVAWLLNDIPTHFSVISNISCAPIVWRGVSLRGKCLKYLSLKGGALTQVPLLPFTALFTKPLAVSWFLAIPWFDWYNSWKYVKRGTLSEGHSCRQHFLPFCRERLVTKKPAALWIALLTGNTQTCTLEHFQVHLQ